MPGAYPPRRGRRRRTRLLAPLLAALALTGAAQAQVRVLFNPGDRADPSARGAAWRETLEAALRRALGTSLQVSLSADAAADSALARSRVPDLLVAPAPVLGTALRHGYLPVASLEPPVQMLLVALADSPAAHFAQTQGLRLGLPGADSVVTRLLRGELAAAHTSVGRHFGGLYEVRHQGALLPCLQVRRCEVAAVERSVARDWMARGVALKVLLESRPAPGLGVVVREGLRPGPGALRAALVDAFAALPADGTPRPVTLAAADLQFVAAQADLAPTALPGVPVVDAATVARLLQTGAVYLDSRSHAEWRAGHIPGTRSLAAAGEAARPDTPPASPGRLPPDRRTLLVFGCSGPESWASYHAAQAAVQAGYTRVHWFRGGLPAWRAAGLPVARAASGVAPVSLPPAAIHPARAPEPGRPAPAGGQSAPPSSVTRSSLP